MSKPLARSAMDQLRNAVRNARRVSEDFKATPKRKSFWEPSLCAESVAEPPVVEFDGNALSTPMECDDEEENLRLDMSRVSLVDIFESEDSGEEMEEENAPPKIEIVPDFEDSGEGMGDEIVRSKIDYVPVVEVSAKEAAVQEFNQRSPVRIKIDIPVVTAPKKKHQRPSRRKKRDAATQTAPLSETMCAALDRLNREHLLLSPPVIAMKKGRKRIFAEDAGQS